MKMFLERGLNKHFGECLTSLLITQQKDYIPIIVHGHTALQIDSSITLPVLACGDTSMN